MIYAQIALKHRERVGVRKQKAPKEQLANAHTSPKRSTAGELRPLGTLFEEQLKVVKYLTHNFKNVDSKRIILVGSGSSAFTALGSLAEDDSKLISAAVAIAPIINWRLIGTKPYVTLRFSSSSLCARHKFTIVLRLKTFQFPFKLIRTILSSFSRTIDSITAEYNLGTPENFAQFHNLNLLYKANDLVKKKFLLIHGTADGKASLACSCFP